MTELRVISASTGMGDLTCQPCGLTWTQQQKTWKVETKALKWMIPKGWNPKHQNSWILKLNCTFFSVKHNLLRNCHHKMLPLSHSLQFISYIQAYSQKPICKWSQCKNSASYTMYMHTHTSQSTHIMKPVWRGVTSPLQPSIRSTGSNYSGATQHHSANWSAQ